MRLFVGGIATESNGFVSYPTPRSDFHVHGDADGIARDDALSAALAWHRLGRERGHEIVPGLLAWAEPSGPTTRGAYESLRDELLDDLARAGRVDAVLLDLHGAMVADGYPDAEGDLIERCRAAVGPGVPIGVFLDLHCHLTRRMVRRATVIITMKEWPHVDVPDRAREILDVIEAVAAGRVRPVMALYDCRMIGAYPTRLEPMRSFVQELHQAEREPGVVSVSVAHGYPWADVPEVGTKMLAVSDGDPGLARTLAERLGRRLFSLRDEITERADFDIDAGLDYALAVPHRPVVLCEQSDSQLGGSAGDATFVLERVVARGIANVAFGPIWDPMSVAICAAAGEGEELMLRIGAKSGPEAGRPVDLRCRIRKVVRGLVQPAMGPIPSVPFGDAVSVIAPNDVDIVLHSRRAGTLRPEVLTDLGIDLARKQIVVAKMWRHGQEGFRDAARDFKLLVTPGTQTLDFARIPFRDFAAPYWPRVADPFAGNGAA